MIAALVFLIAGCQSTAPVPVLSPSPPQQADPVLQRAAEFRHAYGLRADETWIRIVAVNPAAVTDLGVPLLPDEEEIVDARIKAAHAVVDTVKAYGADKPEFAGALIDVERGAIVVASFAGPVARHRAALAKLVPADARLEVRQVVNARDELLALKDAVAVGDDWFKTIKAELESVGVDTERNLVRVEISSANGDAPRLVVDHFGGQGRMYVESDDVGVAFLPIGTLVIIARDARNRPVPGLMVTCTGDLPNTGTGDIGTSTDGQGTWRSKLRATGYTCLLRGGGEIVGTGRAVVEGGKETRLRITPSRTGSA